MNNPWRSLPESEPYVLKEDAGMLESFTFKETTRPRLEILPSPYLGRPESTEIIILSLNPGFKKWDLDAQENNRLYVREKRLSLFFQSAYPWYLLDPRFVNYPGYNWWYSKLRMMIESFGIDTVSHKVMCVQYFPYQSEEFQHQQIIPSQEYSFYLVKQAISKQKIIIQFRGDKHWIDSIPELQMYDRKIIIRSQKNGKKLRNASISSKNMRDEDWNIIISALRL